MTRRVPEELNSPEVLSAIIDKYWGGPTGERRFRLLKKLRLAHMPHGRKPQKRHCGRCGEETIHAVYGPRRGTLQCVQCREISNPLAGDPMNIPVSIFTRKTIDPGKIKLYFDEEDILLADDFGIIRHWKLSEWRDDPSVIISILALVKTGYEEGAQAARALVEDLDKENGDG